MLYYSINAPVTDAYQVGSLACHKLGKTYNLLLPANPEIVFEGQVDRKFRSLLTQWAGPGKETNCSHFKLDGILTVLPEETSLRNPDATIFSTALLTQWGDKGNTEGIMVQHLNDVIVRDEKSGTKYTTWYKTLVEDDYVYLIQHTLSTDDGNSLSSASWSITCLCHPNHVWSAPLSSVYYRIKRFSYSQVSWGPAEQQLRSRILDPELFLDYAPNDYKAYVRQEVIADQQPSWSSVLPNFHRTATPVDTTSSQQIVNAWASRTINVLKERWQVNSSLSPIQDDALGETCNDAISTVNSVQTNAIAYVKESPELFGEINAAKEVLKDAKKVNKWASLALSATYGTWLAFQDTVDMIRGNQAFQRKLNDRYRVARSRKTWDVQSPCYRFINGYLLTTYKLCYDPFDGSGDDKLTYFLDQTGLLPTASRMYDLVPYSFVANWFVDLQSLLDVYDNENRMLRLKTVSESYATKYVFDCVLPAGMSGSACATAYNRRVNPTATLRPSVSDIDVLTVSDHWFEGGCLVLARTKL